MSEQAIGLIELTSVAAGCQAMDCMLKHTAVRLLLSRSIDSGKYLVLMAGDPQAVQAAVADGSKEAHGFLVDQLVMGNVHADVVSALERPCLTPPPNAALGILESAQIASVIAAADAAAKAAPVLVMEVRLAPGLHGKTLCILAGDPSVVQAAVAAGRKILSDRGVLVHSVTISHPRPELWRELL